MVHPKPVPPLAPSVAFCAEVEELRLFAEGTNLRWYADPEKGNLLAEGSEFIPAQKENRKYYVSQSSTYCESELSEVQVAARYFDPSRAFFANVITPNGDSWNQSFYLRSFETEECLGAFRSVKIMNRLGKQVYESSDRDFRWDAARFSTGVYYYTISYTLKSFSGTVQVIR